MGIYIGFMFLLVPPSAHGKHWDWNFAKDGPAAAGCQANHEQQITSTPSNRNESCWCGNIARYIRYRSCMIVMAWWQEIRTVLRTWTSWKLVFDCAGMSCRTSVCIYIYIQVYIYIYIYVVSPEQASCFLLGADWLDWPSQGKPKQGFPYLGRGRWIAPAGSCSYMLLGLFFHSQNHVVVFHGRALRILNYKDMMNAWIIWICAQDYIRIVHAICTWKFKT